MFRWRTGSRGPRKEDAKEERGTGLLLQKGAPFEVVDGTGEGWQAESGLGDLADEGLGGGCGPVFRLGAGPLGAQVVGHALNHELGVGQGQFAAQGEDAGLQRANVHRVLLTAIYGRAKGGGSPPKLGPPLGDLGFR